MGIKDLIKTLKSLGLQTYNGNIKDYLGEVILIDISIIFYKAKNVEIPNPIESYLIKMIYNMVPYDMFPIFVFDGKPCKLKKNTLITRHQVMESQEKHIDELLKISENMSDCIKKEDQKDIKFSMETDKVLVDRDIKKRQKALSLKPTKEEIDNTITLLDKCGISYIISNNHDAESVCAYLEKKLFPKAKVLTKDSDIIAFGASGYISEYKNSNGEVTYISRNDILELLKINSEELTNYCIMLGTDYNNREYGRGPKKALVELKQSDTCGKKEALETSSEEIYMEFRPNYKEFNGFITNIKYLGTKELCYQIIQTIKKNYDTFIKKYDTRGYFSENVEV
jgi:hypothetical protein